VPLVCTYYYAASLDASPANSQRAQSGIIAVIRAQQPDRSLHMRRLLFYSSGEIGLTHRLASSPNHACGADLPAVRVPVSPPRGRAHDTRLSRSQDREQPDPSIAAEPSTP